MPDTVSQKPEPRNHRATEPHSPCRSELSFDIAQDPEALEGLLAMCDAGRKTFSHRAHRVHREKTANCSVFPVIPVRDISLSPRLTER